MPEKDLQRKKQLLEELKEEIFLELDKRIKETEKSLHKDIHHVEEVVEEKVMNEFGEHIEHFETHVEKNKRLRKKMKEDIQAMQARLSYYKLPYAAMVVAGFMLFWYGVAHLIPTIPFLNDARIAAVIGLVLLVVTGAAHKKLVD